MPADSAARRLAAAARRADLAPEARDIADALWLAVTTVGPIGGATTVVSGADEPEAGPDDRRASSAGPSPDRAEPDLDEDGADELTPGPGTGDGLAGRSDEVELRRLPPDGPRPPGLPFRTPGAPELARLELARAMRAFKHEMDTYGDGRLDAETTAHQAAVTDLLLPFFTPERRRSFDVVVVIDTSKSMVVSGQTVHELITTMTELGAFRDIRVVRCDTDDDVHSPVRLDPEGGGAPLDPSGLTDPGGHRIVLVVSDLLGLAWRDGRMGQALETWGKAGPVAVIQPLPQRLWDDCAVPPLEVTIRGGSPAAPNSTLRVAIADESLDDERPHLGTVVPVIELGRRWLLSWSRLVLGDGDELYHGRAIFSRQIGADLDGPVASPVIDPQVAVGRFAEAASIDAALLAPLLAAAAPLTLPVMRLVQQAKLPASAPTALRELFLSGLLEQVSDSGPDPDATVYDFVEGTRKQLLGNLSRQDALSVLVEVSRYLVSRLGSNLDFLALITADRPLDDLDERARAFATVAVDVLESVGGSYRETAARLRRLLLESGGGEPPLPGADESPILEGTVPLTQYSSPTAYTPVRESGYQPAGWKTVPPRNPNFVGRDDMLAHMRNMLVNSAQTAVLLPRALYGLGGVGKTQVAIEYVHRHRSDYDLIWWIAAEDPAEIRRSLVELAEQLEITVTGDTGGTIRRVHEALAERRPFEHWLLVFDNVGDPDAVRTLLPSARFGHVLVTTRESAWAEQGQAVQVDKFNRAESITLLEQQGRLSAEDADTIAARLEDLPISLAQAAAWSSETRGSVAEYLRLFGEELKRREESESLGYPRHAAAAMSIAFNQLRAGSEESAKLLQLASYFGPEWISLELLHRGRLATPFSRRLSRILRDQAPLSRAVKDIARWELARNDTRNLRFQIHRLVQRMVQAEMEPEVRDEVRATVQTMLAYANPGNPDRIAPVEREKHAQLSAHIIASDIIDSDDEEGRQVVLDQIRFRYLKGDYESSRDLAHDVVERWARFGDEDELTLIARRHRANAILSLGNAAEALQIDRGVLAGFEASLGPDHEHTMATVNSVTADLRALGRFAEARQLDEQNYSRQLDVLGADDLATIRTGSNYGVDLRMVGSYQQALELDEQTLAVAQRVLGRQHPTTLVSVLNVAHDLYALGSYGEALRLQRDSLPVTESVYGATHLYTLLSRRVVANSLRKLGRHRAAADEARSLRLAFRARLGDDHPSTLLAMQTATNALRDNGELGEAVRIGEEALAQYRRIFPEHPFTQVCATNVAIAMRQAGRVAEARRLNETALEQLTASFGPDNPYTLCCASNLANDLAAAGDAEGALRLSRDVRERSLVVRGPDQPYTLACEINYALDLIATGDAGGNRMLITAVDRLRGLRDFGEGHPDVALARDGKRLDSDIEPPPT